ncbi:ABC-2 type transporter [Solidesulfovibrio fructosivorans JJ]]|uniref:ABC-2 type transporter n=1 Tax=Solidesulfovibrio fructosivorans JJ] TaxID=596151 RepID=E1JWW4_SOLFR|nr:ABC transporter permease subunit [Solidesulfovibrio fructosivorans]EFL51168.1 ABC-2 type transporter [Solidesulfovibrio fructosivorans JJ]]
MNSSMLIARKEAGTLLRSPRGLAWLVAMAVALSIFCLLLVSDTELSLLDNAQVVYDMAGLITALGALLAVILGVDALAGERDRGSLPPLLLTPVAPESILLGKLGGIVIVWAVLFALALPYLWAVGSTGQNLMGGIAVLALFGSPVVIGFGCLALGLGARLDSSRSGLLTSFVLLLLAASPLIFGPSLRQTTVGMAFDAINPFAAAINAYDAVVIDSASLLSQWAHALVILAWLALFVLFARHAFQRLLRSGGGL